LNIYTKWGIIVLKGVANLIIRKGKGHSNLRDEVPKITKLFFDQLVLSR